ncbi:hypothetical protein BDW59DRAFT_139089 [Aspergillus cavernicola]|uniref:Uncharacterized protein n=1 Tax=Aspergillus cavernicola TaxID=176166 RepID=A0ABR4IZ25_9EURO
MCPDINSLPPSRSTSASPRQRRTLSSLLDTLAPTQSISSIASSNEPSPSMSNNHPSNNGTSTTTADVPRRHHPMVPISGSERRRSSNLNLSSTSNNSYNEPSIGDMPSPSDHRSSIGHGLRTSSPSNIGGSPVIGTGDPHHQRAPSLGELHQELEQEQEAQVNRLLQTIRSQQSRLHHLEQQHQQQSVIDDITSSSERSSSFLPVATIPNAGSRTSTQLPSSLSSRRPSQAHSPNIRPLADSPRGPDTLEWIPGPGESAGRRGSRDESSSFYQTEATTLARENQMLRQRIQELERQVSDLTTNASTRGPSATSTLSSRTPDEPNTGEPQAAVGAGSDGESSDKT